ncbi:hypothetical protein Tco_1575860 [Tanacetum coccineum]
MANLDFCDKHNMVAYLQKSEGKQFWQTAFVSTLENGDMEITATIDGKVKVVFEASIRRHLKLEDSDGISTLLTSEIFEQLALMGYVSNSDNLTFQKGHFSPQWKFLIHTILYCLSPKKTAWEQFSSNIATAIICLATNRTFNFSKLIFDAMGQILQGERSTIPVESHHTPISALSTLQPPTSPPSMKITHVAEEATNMPYDSPLPRGHTPGSDEGSMTLNELTVLCTQLSIKVASLEADLKQTKKVYGNTYTKLIMKVKKLKHKVKSSKARRIAQFVVSDDEEDDSFNQGRKIDKDPNISLFTAPEEVYTAEPDISTANVPVSTASAETKTKIQQEQERLGFKEAQRLQQQFDKKERQRIISVHEEANTFKPEEWDNIQAQIEADEELAHRLQAQEREGYSEADKAKLLVELINERKRQFSQQRAQQRRNRPLTQAQQRSYMCNYIKHMGSHTLQQLRGYSFDEIKVLFEATVKRVNTFTPMESDDTVPKVVAGSSKRSAEEELGEESSKRQKIGEGSEPAEESKDKESDELSQEQLQQLIIIVPEEGMNVEALQTKYPIIDWENFDRDDLVKLWDLVRERFSSTEPTDDKERALWVELKRLFEPDTDDLLELQRYMHDPLTWRLYDTCGVHHVSTETGLDIFMLVEKDYPMTRGLPMLMLVNKLQVDQHSEMADELLRKIFILANRPRH